MANTVFEIQVPESLLRFGLDQRGVQQRVTEWLVITLFTDGHISSGKAARLLEMTRHQFLDLLRSRGIAYVNFTAGELQEEFDAVDRLTIEAQA